MKRILKKLYLIPLAAIVLLSCKKEPEFVTTDVGPVISKVVTPEKAYMGGWLEFSADMNDPIDLSTLKVQLFFDEDMVSDTTIRTKANGTYSGKIKVPYYANIPDGVATVKFIGQNIQFGLTEIEQDIAIERPDFEYLTLEIDGRQYKMSRTEKYNYEITDNFPAKCDAVITSSPIGGEGGPSIVFGWGDGEIRAGAAGKIPFANSVSGNFKIFFNTKTFDAGPFISIMVNGTKAVMSSTNVYSIVLNLEQNGSLKIEGNEAGFADWFIDPDFFETVSETGEFKFLPVAGLYKLDVDFNTKFIRVEAMKDSNNLGVLNTDGTGAVWVIGGTCFGKPGIANGADWKPEQGGLCLSQISPKKHQITLVAGVQVTTDAIDFKFFHQKTWGGEFGGGMITTDSPLLKITSSGNVNLADGVKLDAGGIYKFTLDLTNTTYTMDGSKILMSGAVLSLEKEGEQELPQKEITICGQKMEMMTADQYTINIDLEQNQEITVTGLDDMTSFFLDPDYLRLEGSSIRFNATSGKYNIFLNAARNYAVFKKLAADGSDAVLADGALWMMAWGLAHPVMKWGQFAFNPGKAFCMAEVAPKVFQLTGIAVDEEDAVTVGGRIRYDYVSFKYFYQNGWGGEMTQAEFTPSAKEYLKQTYNESDKKWNNIELADGVELEKGAVYRLTIDLSGGTVSGNSYTGTEKVDFVKIN